MAKHVGFRGWFYLRIGWSTYFAFIFAAINTLTVTYYLAIDNYPALKEIFPSFEQYLLIIVSIGIPILILTGYSHYKKTKAFRSEVDIWIESNPYQRRNTVNSELLVRMNLELMTILLKVAKKEDLSDDEIEKITKLHNEIIELSTNRTLTDGTDMNFLKKEIVKL